MGGVRPAREQDAAAIAGVHVAAWQWAYRGIMPDEFLDGLDATRRERPWQETITAGNGAVFVAEDEGRIVGFAHVAGHADDDDAELYAIYLLEDWTGRGLGRALLEAAERAMSGFGCHEAVLWVARENLVARRFYERGGWSYDGGEDIYSLPGLGLPVVRYRRHLETGR